MTGVRTKGEVSEAGPTAASPGYVLWHAALAWQRMVVTAMKPTGLTHVQYALLAAAAQLGEPSQRQLAQAAGTDVMMTSQVLRTLEDKKGFVKRTTDTGDARIRRVQITPKGRKALDKASEALASVDRTFFANAGQIVPALRKLTE